LSDDCEIEWLADLTLAPLFFRLLIGNASVASSFSRACIAHLIGENEQPMRVPRRRARENIIYIRALRGFHVAETGAS
jgi:hypothetical protein